MGTTNRVLSGSLTRGSTATPMTGAIEYTYQGIYGGSDKVFFGSLIPRITFGKQLRLAKVGQPSGSVTFISKDIFDDTLTVNNDVADIRNNGDERAQFLVSFDMGTYNFGQAPTTQQGEPFVETNTYDAKRYIQADHDTMWPVNLFNAGSLLDHEYDGIIEPFDIRGEILGTVDTRYEGHAVRADLGGSFIGSTLGNHALVTSWLPDATKPTPFLDAPETFGLSILSGSRDAHGVWDGINERSYYHEPVRMTGPVSPALNSGLWIFYNGGGDISVPAKAAPLKLLISGSSKISSTLPVGFEGIRPSYREYYKVLIMRPPWVQNRSPARMTTGNFGAGDWTVSFKISFHEDFWNYTTQQLQNQVLGFYLQTANKAPQLFKEYRLSKLAGQRKITVARRWPNNYLEVSFSFSAKDLVGNRLWISRGGIFPAIDPIDSTTYVFDFEMYRTISRPNRISGPIALPGRWSPNQNPDSPFVDTTEKKRRNTKLLAHNPAVWLPGKYNLSASYGSWYGGTKFTPNNPAGLKAWWKIDEDLSYTGSAHDSSGNGNPANFATGSEGVIPTPYNKVNYIGPLFNNPGETPSTLIQQNTSFFFTGSGQGPPDTTDVLLSVNNPSDNSLSFTSGGKDTALTILFRCKPVFTPGTVQTMTILQKMGEPAAVEEYSLQILADGASPVSTGRLVWTMKTSANQFANMYSATGILSSSGWTGNDNQWYNIAVVYNGSASAGGGINASFYLNGSKLSSVASTVQNNYNGQVVGQGMFCSSGSLFIGGRATYVTGPNTQRSSEFFSGSLCDISMWGREWSSQEIIAWHLAGSGSYSKEPSQPQIVTALENMARVDNDDANKNLKHATTGFYFGNKAGSITFGDI